MFDRLRLRLTSVYMLAVLALVVGVGGGAYGLLSYYFGSSTDLALRYRATVELRLREARIPDELLLAEHEYLSSGVILAPTTSRHVNTQEGEDHESDETSEVRYQPDQAPIFALLLNTNGAIIPSVGTTTAPIAPDATAARAAVSGGSDARTVWLTDGTRVRLLSYRLDHDGGDSSVVQVGRVLSDQDAVLRNLLSGLLLLALPVAAVVGLASWWMAGRSLDPAHRAWERQQSFVANASHELRTPITLVRASTEVALRGIASTEQDQRDLLEDVLQECTHMSRLVDDLLLLSRLDAGQVALTQAPVQLAELLSDIARQIGRVAEQRGVRVQVATAQGVAQADPTRLRQVLLILIDNALKYTASGGTVTLSAQLESSSAAPQTGPLGIRRQAHLAIRVTDTGCGIDAAHLPHLFERFYRVDGARGAGSGTGLGLAIAKGLIEAQHGRISVFSTVGQGTEVLVRIPTCKDDPSGRHA